MEAISDGVASVLDGPASDELHRLECRAYEEARLRCELLRAQIRATDRETRLHAFLVRHIVLRNHCILVVTISAFGGYLALAQQPQTTILSAVVAVITATLLAGARALAGQLHKRQQE